MRVVELKRISPVGSGVPGAFSPAVIVAETPDAVHYYRPCRPDIEQQDRWNDVVIRAVG